MSTTHTFAHLARRLMAYAPPPTLPDLSKLAAIDLAELATVLGALGLDPDNVQGVHITHDGILVHEHGTARAIQVIEQFEPQAYGMWCPPYGDWLGGLVCSVDGEAWPCKAHEA